MQLSETIHQLAHLLGQVLLEQETQAVIETEERIRKAAKARRSFHLLTAQAASKAGDEICALDTTTARAIAGAFALYFDLINTAEDNQRIATLRDEARQKDLAPVHDSIEKRSCQMKPSA